MNKRWPKSGNGDGRWLFYNFIGEGGCRLMCSWDTTEGDVREFAGDMAGLMK